MTTNENEIKKVMSKSELKRTNVQRGLPMDIPENKIAIIRQEFESLLHTIEVGCMENYIDNPSGYCEGVKDGCNNLAEKIRTLLDNAESWQAAHAKYAQPTANNQIPAKSVMNLLKAQEPLGAEFSKVLHENLWDLYEKDNSTNSAAQPTTIIKAKPLVWEVEGQGTDWHDTKCDFHIEFQNVGYVASWGEGDAELFKTLDEAKQWCQDQLEDWINELII